MAMTAAESIEDAIGGGLLTSRSCHVEVDSYRVDVNTYDKEMKRERGNEYQVGSFGPR